jgi:precorrin-3B synthase
VLRPWPAPDGGLVRLRLIGGALPVEQLAALAEVSEAFGDGEVHLTARANLQVRGLRLDDGLLPAETLAALLATGLVPHPSHELVRNVMVSPLTGISGGLADLRRLAIEYDDLLCADPELAALPGRFLVVLDDGRGDLQGRSLDLGVMAVDEGHVQLRAGTSGWGEVVPVGQAAARLVDLAHAFLAVRGEGAGAAWHVDELAEALVSVDRDVRTLRNAGPLPYGPFDGGEHLEVAGGVLSPALIETLTEALTGSAEGRLVVTPWNGVVVTA